VKYQLGHVGECILTICPVVDAREFHYQVVYVKDTPDNKEDDNTANRVLAMQKVMTSHPLFVIFGRQVIPPANQDSHGNDANRHNRRHCQIRDVLGKFDQFLRFDIVPVGRYFSAAVDRRQGKYAADRRQQQKDGDGRRNPDRRLRHCRNNQPQMYVHASKISKCNSSGEAD